MKNNPDSHGRGGQMVAEGRVKIMEQLYHVAAMESYIAVILSRMLRRHI